MKEVNLTISDKMLALESNYQRGLQERDNALEIAIKECEANVQSRCRENVSIITRELEMSLSRDFKFDGKLSGSDISAIVKDYCK